MEQPTLLYYNIHHDVIAFSTTRQGGVSTGNYASFNINRYCGDSEEAIKGNRRQLCDLLQIDDEHEDDIPYEDKEDCEEITEYICHESAYELCIFGDPVKELAGSSFVYEPQGELLVFLEELLSKVTCDLGTEARREVALRDIYYDYADT